MVTTERRAIPRDFTSPKANRLRNNAIIGLVVATAALAPVAMLMAQRASSAAGDAVAAVTQTTEARHTAFAEVVASQWAYGGSDPVAGPDATLGRPELTAETIDVIDGIGLVEGPVNLPVLSLAWSEATFSASTVGIVEHHDFVMSTPDGLFVLTVSVAEAEIAGTPTPYLVARPSLAPYVGPDTEDIDDFGWEAETVTPPQRLAEKVGEWVTAFVTDDSGTLNDLALTAEDSDATLSGLAGNFVVVGEPTLQAYADIPNSENPESGYVRVRFDIANPNGVYLSLEYDLLVTDPRGGLAIVAWGPAGSAPTLQPGQNFVEPGSTTEFGLGGVARTDISDNPDPDQGNPEASARRNLTLWLGRVDQAQQQAFSELAGYQSIDELELARVLSDTTYRGVAQQSFFTQQGHVTDEGRAYCVSMSIRELTMHIGTGIDEPTEGPCPPELTAAPAPTTDDADGDSQ